MQASEQFKNAVLNYLDETESTVFHGSQYGEENGEVEVHRPRKDRSKDRSKKPARDDRSKKPAIKTFTGRRAEGIKKALAARLPNRDADSRNRINPGSASHDNETMDQDDREVATVHNRTEGAAIKKRFPKKKKP